MLYTFSESHLKKKKKILFIIERAREREHELGDGGYGQRARDKQTPFREPDAELHLRTPGT